MDMRIPPLNIKITLESRTMKSRILVRRLAVPQASFVSGNPEGLRDFGNCRRLTEEVLGDCKRVT